MGGVVFGAVLPHGWTLIPELDPDVAGVPAVYAAMLEVGRRCAAARPDVIVIATPHGVRVDDAICLAGAGRAAGSLHADGPSPGRVDAASRTVEMNIPVDLRLTETITETARAAGVPIAVAGFAGNRAAESCIPLDWGVAVPAWFLGHDRHLPGGGNVLSAAPDEDIGPPVVIVTPSRRLSRETMVRFGEAVADAAAKDGRRVAFVASCDWAHAHAGSRYGASPAAAEVDGLVVDALRAGEPGRLIDLDQAKMDAAAIDGLWQALMLAGVLNRVPMRGEFLAYEVAAAFSCGMAVAAFEPVS
jgi:aromatic ring-opening dioxygenase LigB subunit